jgi:hypothetical protein
MTGFLLQKNNPMHVSDAQCAAFTLVPHLFIFAMRVVCRMSEQRDQPREGDRWFVNARRVLFVSPPSATGDRLVWHTQFARTVLQPTDRVDCIRASTPSQFELDGTPVLAMKPPKKDGVGFKGGSAAHHEPALTHEAPLMELQTPAAQLQRKFAFAQEHSRMFTTTNKQLFQTPLVPDSTFCFCEYSFTRACSKRIGRCLAGTMATNPEGETSAIKEALEFLQWPLPTMSEERLILAEEDVTEDLTAETAVRWLFERDPSVVSDDTKARLAFIAAGYVPSTTDGTRALHVMWHTWVATHLGARNTWSDTVKEYMSSGHQLLLGYEPEGAAEHGDVQTSRKNPAMAMAMATWLWRMPPPFRNRGESRSRHTPPSTSVLARLWDTSKWFGREWLR